SRFLPAFFCLPGLSFAIWRFSASVFWLISWATEASTLEAAASRTDRRGRGPEARTKRPRARRALGPSVGARCSVMGKESPQLFFAAAAVFFLDEAPVAFWMWART